MQGAAYNRQGSRSEGTLPERNLVGIAVCDLDVFDGPVQSICDYLSERRRMALPVRVAAAEYGDFAGRVHTNERAVSTARSPPTASSD
jgi:hypothetical protein